jgi:hypothetical protein
MVAGNIFSASDALKVRNDYPPITSTGYINLDSCRVQGAFAELIGDLSSAHLAEILSDKLQIDLHDRPRMITVLRQSHTGMGKPHTDSASKICTMLVYLNPVWEMHGSGAIRVLRNGTNLDDYVREIPPLEGNAFAFRRSEWSWHGHTPCVGERFVVQTTFLRDATELRRKQGRGRMQAILKRLNPFTR